MTHCTLTHPTLRFLGSMSHIYISNSQIFRPQIALPCSYVALGTSTPPSHLMSTNSYLEVQNQLCTHCKVRYWTRNLSLMLRLLTWTSLGFAGCTTDMVYLHIHEFIPNYSLEHRIGAATTVMYATFKIKQAKQSTVHHAST